MTSERLTPVFSAFVHVTPSHESHGYWRHPDGAHMADFANVDAWVHVAKTLEAGFFDMMFIADTVGAYDTYQGSRDSAVRQGMHFPGLDPSIYAALLARETTHLGFGVTNSVIQDAPFTFARRMSTLDHVSNGRIGWNIVTSYLPSAARNYGLADLPDHDARYARAQEFADVCYRLWETSWEDDAFVSDVARNMLIDPERVHAIDHVGEHYSVAGPHMAPPTPQRTPLLLQAGASAQGRAFAGMNAEASFLVGTDREHVAGQVAQLVEATVAAGREPSHIVPLLGVFPVIASSEGEAARQKAELLEWIDDDGMLSFVSGLFGVDLATVDPDMPARELLARAQVSGSVKALLAMARDDRATIGQVAKSNFVAGWAGTPEQFADAIEGWCEVGVRGFNIAPITTLRWWDEFVEHTVPVLQARGLMQTSYRPGTLREKLFGHGPFLPPQHRARRQPAPTSFSGSTRTAPPAVPTSL